MNTKQNLPTKLVLAFASFVLTTAAFAQGTAFTYQGRLDHAGNPAHGSYDLNFSLYDVASGGSPIGPVLSRPATPVSNGLFTVTLDFGNQFPGANRWLEIAVRTNGGGAFSSLSPRQALTATPYAVQALNAGSAATVISVPAANIAGTVPDARLSTNVALRAGGNNFSGDQTLLNGYLRMGVNQGILVQNASGNYVNSLTPRWNDEVTYLDHASNGLHIRRQLGGSSMLIDSAGNVGIGTITPNSKLHVNGVVTASGFEGPINSDNLTGPISVNGGVPRLAGAINNGGDARRVAVSGGYAYLASLSGGLRVYNVGNPANPVNVTNVLDPGEAYGIAISGNYAYLANGTGGLRVYDISNRARPVGVGSINNGGVARGVTVSGSHVYLADANGAFRVYNGSNPANPINTANIPTAFARNVTVAGNHAYLATSDGVLVFNLSNPANPVLVTNMNGSLTFDVAVSGRYAYLATGTWMPVYDINNPASPVFIQAVDNNGGVPRGVTVAENYLYLANGPDGLRVYNIASPAFPLPVGHIDNSEDAWHVAVSGNHAFLANSTDGLRIYGMGFLETTYVDSDLGGTFGGSVGIGTANPVAPLDLSTSLGEKISLWGNSPSNIIGFGIQGALMQIHTDGPGTDIAFGHGPSASMAEVMRIKGNGNVGIGTSTPLTRLHVNGVVTANGFDGPLNAVNLTGTVPDARLSANVALRAGGNNFTGSQTVMSGSVGIGTTNPGTRLEVQDNFGAARITPGTPGFSSFLEFNNRTALRGLIGGDGPGFSGATNSFSIGTWSPHPIRFFANQVESMTIASDGNVGIGTSNPGLNDVQINPTFHSANGYGLVVNRADYGMNVQINRPFGTGGIGLVVDNSALGDSSTSLLLVRNNVSGTPQTAMNVRADGRTQVKELEITGGADLAEPFNVSAGLEAKPGMVMAIHPDKPGELRVATEAYDRTVAGIISGAGGVKAGLTLRQEESAADGSHPVALSGRVYCWVDAEANGAVRPGDLLTTSETAGHAMRATDHSRSHGAVLGKAMTKLEKGRGLVLVLVNLQ